MPASPPRRTPLPLDVAASQLDWELGADARALLDAFGARTLGDLAGISEGQLVERWSELGLPEGGLRHAMWGIKDLLLRAGGHLAWDHPPQERRTDTPPSPTRALAASYDITAYGVRVHLPQGAPPPKRADALYHDWLMALPEGDEVALSVGKAERCPGLEKLFMGSFPDRGAELRYGPWGCLLSSTWNGRLNHEARWSPELGVLVRAYYYKGTPGEQLAEWLRSLVLRVTALPAPESG